MRTEVTVSVDLLRRILRYDDINTGQEGDEIRAVLPLPLDSHPWVEGERRYADGPGGAKKWQPRSGYEQGQLRYPKYVTTVPLDPKPWVAGSFRYSARTEVPEGLLPTWSPRAQYEQSIEAYLSPPMVTPVPAPPVYPTEKGAGLEIILTLETLNPAEARFTHQVQGDPYTTAALNLTNEQWVALGKPVTLTVNLESRA